MRVLLDDVLQGATITSAKNASPNYPAKNILHPFLRKRYQFTKDLNPLEYDTRIDILLPYNKDINCFFVGYHDLSSISIQVRNSSYISIGSKTVTSLAEIQPIYFSSKLSGARYIQISANGSFMGKISAGVYTQFPDLVAQYDSGQTDNSSFFESAEGQTLVNEIEPLRSLSYSIRELEDNSFLLKYRAKPLFIDLYELAPWKEAPVYGRFTTPFGLTYNPRRYDTSFDIKECR